MNAIHRPLRARSRRGFSFLELLVAGTIIGVVGLAGAAYVTRSAQGADWSRDRVFARQKALSILSELKSFVEGSANQAASELDGFDDGLVHNPTLTIAPDPTDPTRLAPPDHPLSGNVQEGTDWRWYRHITVRRFSGVAARDLRIATVRVWRHRSTDAVPGEQMAEVSSVVRTVADSYPTSQVFDVYLLALENTPGWWVYLDAMKPFIDATLQDLEARNPGLVFRTHWITTSGYGRDEEYAPYTNETRISTDDTKWAYVYPGKMPTGLAATRYYVPLGFRGRVNLDGDVAPAFANDYVAPEAYTDDNGNGKWDPTEPFTDSNANGQWDVGRTVPYAIADQHNHAMRAPDESTKFAARVAAGLDTDDAPTYRMLLDRMIAEPARFHNAILVNLHGELLPMPAVRNYSDAAKDPNGHPGWRVVSHPEKLFVKRQGAGTEPEARWRVYAYKTEFPTAEALMTLREPFTDVNKNGVRDAAEPFQDWNANAVWDDSTAATLEITNADLTYDVNGSPNPSLVVKRLSGGIDADGSGAVDSYSAFANAPRFPETWTDSNGDGMYTRGEAYFDRNGNGAYNASEPFTDVDANGVWTSSNESFVDGNANARADVVTGPADVFTDVAPLNGAWDPAEPFFDINGNGVRNGPTTPVLPWRAWSPGVDDVSAASRTSYATSYGEPYKDVNFNGAWSPAEPLLYDNNGNGRFDGGYRRGEMWFKTSYEATTKTTIVELYGTPLYCGETTDGRGLDAGQRLYDLEYVPCPMTNSTTSTSPFERDLYNTTVDVPKNTARWTVEAPKKALKKAFEIGFGADDGDQRDRMIELRTRIGTDRTTGTMWPVRSSPSNVSRTWSYYFDDAKLIPFSERYQFQGDPRHSPYADSSRMGTTFPNGYNWYFDDFNGAVNAQTNWKMIDPTRLADGWMGAQQIDTARYFQWIRTAITNTEAIYTTLTGFSYYYLSVGGDVGYDSANGFASSIPMSGRPFGANGSIYEDTIADGGTAGVAGSQKYVRSNDGGSASIRAGGHWWSKPWLGELWQDAAYGGQWSAWGNLRALVGTTAQTYRQVNRDQMPTAQQPPGTGLKNMKARTGAEGCTSYFNIGSSGSTFHHQYRDGEDGTLVSDGTQLAANYNFPLPATAAISRPFSLTSSGDGGLPSEFSFTTEYPRFSASQVVQFFNHESGTTGSALIRHVDPTGTKGSHIVVNGLDRTVGSGSAFISRYSLISLVHSTLAAGLSGTGRVKQLPRLQIVAPTGVTELSNPATIPVQWKVEWKRWDGLKYTSAYAAGFTESESDLVYVLLKSIDGGSTWMNMKTDETVDPAALPVLPNGTPDPARTWSDAGVGNESWTWSTPAATYPEGSYLVRIVAFRKSEQLHFAFHQEKIYVNR